MVVRTIYLQMGPLMLATSTLSTVGNLGNVYKHQGKLKEAEEMYQRALAGYEKALSPDHTPTLDIVNNFGNLYFKQGKLNKAEEMYQRALTGYKKALGPDHTYTLDTINNLGILSKDQGKLKEAKEVCEGESPDSQQVANLNLDNGRRAITS
ncbi:kinesin light chain [Penicillium malachiteum]|uniref:kinesin light chain n=1 Tax=Penicillium malachiteum TaxID=1324776 RepID=UPI0025497C9B|nr:kinesin light chain [Penicillium malachiteum]KAJ5729350.1 kinesin light chain [Penicillium malachiteum]